MRSVREIDWESLTKGPFTPSPTAWEDHPLYFLLLDRFSDGNEAQYRDKTGTVLSSGETPPLVLDRDAEGAVQTPEMADAWREAGNSWCGGTLRGAATKLGYLQRLGVGALWISPVLKQAAHAAVSYHGYGTQDFLDVDPHFGTRDDLRALVRSAHDAGLYVVLDVVFNHAADVFAYEGAEGTGEMHPWRPEPYPVRGFRDATGKPSLPFGAVDDDAYPDGAIWPRELQSPECFTRKGSIGQWDELPEYKEGDFFTFKDLNLGDEAEEGNVDSFQPSPALQTLVDVYKFWIAFADLDGFRIDTVKHMPAGAVHYFAREIHAFARSLGKQRFLLVGEVIGERDQSCTTLECTGLDSALGIGEVPEKIRGLITGSIAPSEYFDIFANSRREAEADPNPVWWRDRVVTFFDDHDQVGKDPKGRLASEFADRDEAESAILRAVALQVTTLGIPCMYYGTEQGFDGRSGDTDDRYIREAMFGGPFGPFRSTGHHCFAECGWLYRQIALLFEARRNNPALRRGRQYLREVSEDGHGFGFPGPGPDGEPYQGIIAWSRLLDVDALLCAINTDPIRSHSLYITIDADRHPPGGRPLVCLYSTQTAQIGTETCPPEPRNGSAVRITVPPGGFVLYR